jgi:hypothetical protein
MKTLYKNFILLTVSFICSISLSQTWPKYYTQTDSYDYTYDIMETYDKGYMICGNFYTYDGSEYKAWSWLIKTDINGNIQWDKVIEGGDDVVISNAVEQTSDGGILTCGSIWTNAGAYDPFMMKLNACGEKEWCKIFTGSVSESTWFEDIKVTPSGEIIVLAVQFEEWKTMHLFKFSDEGDFLWKKAYCDGDIYSGAFLPQGKSITLISEGRCIISAEVYWEDPWNPGGPAGIRPLFVMVDSLGNEEWVLPFGLQDTIYGQGYTIYEINNNKFIGVAVKWIDQSSTSIASEYLIESCNSKYLALKNILIDFDSTGYVYQYLIIENEVINPSYTKGVANVFERIDSVYVMGGLFGDQNGGNPAEIILDTNVFNNLTVLDYYLHLNENEPYSAIKSFDKKILSNSSFFEPGVDIVLSKLNLNLEYDTAYPGNYTYDSLCTTPGLPQNGFIYLDECDIITGEEIPSPEDYYSFIATIPITAYPNPAETEINLAFQNTEHHTNMMLECYNIYGQNVHSEKIWKGQQKTTIDLSNWAKGLYFAVVKSEGKVAGTGRFVRR